jgi:hypothetical protein
VLDIYFFIDSILDTGSGAFLPPGSGMTFLDPGSGTFFGEIFLQNLESLLYYLHETTYS